MKANTSALMRKGYTTGVFSGMTWGLDTVLIGVAMAMVREVVEKSVIAPTQQDIIKIRREAEERAIQSGALGDTDRKSVV